MATLFAFAGSPLAGSAEDWPQFRGPNSTGVSSESKNLPVEFSHEKNVMWSVKLGRGIASPVIASGRLFETAMLDQKTFAVMAFDAYPRTVLSFTSDPEALRGTLAHLELTAGDPAPPPASMATGPMSAGPRINAVPVGPGAPNSTASSPRTVKCLHDALYAAGTALREREAGRRRVVFLISDGRNSRLNLHTSEETLALLLSEDVSVYALGVGEARYPRGSNLLADYARATGGDVYAPGSLSSLEQSQKRVAEQARYQYTLVYAARPAPGSREFRRIEVNVRREGVRVQARQGYYAGLAEH